MPAGALVSTPRLSLITAALLCLAPSAASAQEWFEHEESGVQIAVPESGWLVDSMDEDTLAIVEEEQAVIVLLWVVPEKALEDAIRTVDEAVAKWGMTLELGDDEPDELDLNGMPALTWTGDGTVDGGEPVEFMLIIFQAPSGDAVITLALHAEGEGGPELEQQTTDILMSIRPAE
jgi:hypothetical protein